MVFRALDQYWLLADDLEERYKELRRAAQHGITEIGLYTALQLTSMMICYDLTFFSL